MSKPGPHPWRWQCDTGKGLVFEMAFCVEILASDITIYLWLHNLISPNLIFLISDVMIIKFDFKGDCRIKDKGIR